MALRELQRTPAVSLKLYAGDGSLTKSWVSSSAFNSPTPIQNGTSVVMGNNNPTNQKNFTITLANAEFPA